MFPTQSGLVDARPQPGPLLTGTPVSAPAPRPAARNNAFTADDFGVPSPAPGQDSFSERHVMNIPSAINAGLFVQFIANQWNSSGPTTSLTGQQVVWADGNPVAAGKTYTVLQTFYANDLATDFDKRPGSVPKGRVTIGIVAADAADENDVVVAVRGTSTIWEWLQDCKFLYKPFANVPGAPLTEDGFTDMYLSFSFTNPPAAGAVTFIAGLIGMLPPKARVTVVGHSLGAALATLLALDLAVHSTELPVNLYTLASPRVGDPSFARLFDHIVPNAFRVANRIDVVPKVPPPLMYLHVGDETELVPDGTLRFDLACEHHLTSYFHMLGGLTVPSQADQYPIQPDCLRNSGALGRPEVA